MNDINTKSWHLERVIYLLAGTFTLISIGLSFFLNNQWYLILALMVGVNLLVYSLTGFCVMAISLQKLGIKSKCG